MTDRNVLTAAAQFTLDWAFSQKTMFVSAGGGTFRVLAGEISRFCNVPFEDACAALDAVGDYWHQDWYSSLYHDVGRDAYFNPGTDARGVGKALQRRVKIAEIPLPFEEFDELPPRRGFWA